MGDLQMEKFKALLQKKAKEGKFIKDDKDIKARLEMVGGMEDIAQESFGAKIKGLQAKKAAQKSTPEVKAEPEVSEDMKIGKSQEEQKIPAADMPENESEEYQAEEGDLDSESAKTDMQKEAKEAFDLKIKNIEKKLAAKNNN
jgi:hypothetical protein